MNKLDEVRSFTYTLFFVKKKYVKKKLRQISSNNMETLSQKIPFGKTTEPSLLILSHIYSH